MPEASTGREGTQSEPQPLSPDRMVSGCHFTPLEPPWHLRGTSVAPPESPWHWAVERCSDRGSSGAPMGTLTWDGRGLRGPRPPASWTDGNRGWPAFSVTGPRRGHVRLCCPTLSAAATELRWGRQSAWDGRVCVPIKLYWRNPPRADGTPGPPSATATVRGHRLSPCVDAWAGGRSARSRAGTASHLEAGLCAYVFCFSSIKPRCYFAICSVPCFLFIYQHIEGVF